MTPPEAIPPLTEQGLLSLVGESVKVRRLSNPSKVWWVKIVEVRYVSKSNAIVRISGHHSFGKERDVALSEIIWPGKPDRDALSLQIKKARYDAGIK